MSIPFSRIQSVSQLGRWLGLDQKLLNAFLKAPSMSSFYMRHLLAPRGKHGKFRAVYEPIEVLAAAQKAVAKSIVQLYGLPQCVHGYVGGRSTLSNAAEHLGRRIVLCADIEDFFGSLTEEAVTVYFCGIGATIDVSQALARVCCLDGAIPQGARSSPVLSNVLCTKMDSDLTLLSVGLGCVYTRYSDDLTFSGDRVPSREQLSACLAKHGLRLNASKYRVQKRGARQFVTGLSVVATDKPRLPSALKKYLRTRVFFATKYGGWNHSARVRAPSAHHEFNRINGLLNYAIGVEPSFARPLRRAWRRSFPGEYGSEPDHEFEQDEADDSEE